ncbi:MAG: hypothetical protein M3066_02635 [Actinomycetota bacterium]|nr:hypothetical protein [Actinomycetota bacterium]
MAEVYALADAVHPRYRALVLTAAFAGPRRGELFGLSRSDIDPLHRTVTVSVQPTGSPLSATPKTDAGRRTIVLPAEWNRARRTLGLDHLHFHDLRHVAGTLAAATGAGTKELMYRLGHASPQAALRDQHATRECDTAIAEAMSALIRRRDLPRHCRSTVLRQRKPAGRDRRTAVHQDGRALGHAKVTPVVPGRPR